MYKKCTFVETINTAYYRLFTPTYLDRKDILLKNNALYSYALSLLNFSLKS